MTTTKTRDFQVLVVEDEGMVAMLLEDMLADLGHQVVATVGNIERASELVADTGFDLAILDVNLNGRHTYPLAETLQQRGIPFVFATGYGRSGLEAKWKDTPVLQKPFTEQDLQRVIQIAMAR
ncbi:MAG: response regulator [Rhodomicrobiaceae bacterium]